jgi:hypothetical protein
LKDQFSLIIIIGDIMERRRDLFEEDKEEDEVPYIAPSEE